MSMKCACQGSLGLLQMLSCYPRSQGKHNHKHYGHFKLSAFTMFSSGENTSNRIIGVYYICLPRLLELCNKCCDAAQGPKVSAYHKHYGHFKFATFTIFVSGENRDTDVCNMCCPRSQGEHISLTSMPHL
jgi:hypothetical protein